MTFGVTIEQLRDQVSKYVKLIKTLGFGEQAFSTYNQMDKH